MTDAATRLTALAERIELWPVERLRPYERNPRTHGADQVAQLAASMVEFGFTNPILVDESSGILAGHGRLMAARQLGLAEVPVVRLEHLSEAQKRAYIIADNGLALQSAWDEQRGKGRKILNDNMGDGFEAFLTDACANLVGVTKGAIYIAMSSSELHTLPRAFAAAGGKWSTFVIWAKHAFTRP